MLGLVLDATLVGFGCNAVLRLVLDATLASGEDTDEAATISRAFGFLASDSDSNLLGD